MNPNNEEQRWRGPSANQQRSQGGGQGGQRRNMPRDGSSYSGPNYNSQNNTSNGNAWGGRNMNYQQHHQTVNASFYDSHAPVNGFNAQDALEMLVRGYEVQAQAARAQAGPEVERPVFYRGEKGWSTPKNSGAWGQRPNAMASGNNFLAQLKKSHAALQNTGKD